MAEDKKDPDRNAMRRLVQSRKAKEKNPRDGQRRGRYRYGSSAEESTASTDRGKPANKPIPGSGGADNPANSYIEENEGPGVRRYPFSESAAEYVKDDRAQGNDPNSRLLRRLRATNRKTPAKKSGKTEGNTGGWREKGYVLNGNGKGKGEVIDELLNQINGK